MSQPLPWSSEATVLKIIDGLEGFISTYVRSAMARTDAPAAYHLGAALAGIAAVFPPRMVMDDAMGGDLHGNLFVMLIGRQGTDRKSTSLSRLTKHILAKGAPGRRMEHPGSAAGMIRLLEQNPQQLLTYPDMGTFLSQTQNRRGGNQGEEIKIQLLPLFDCEPVSRVLSQRETACENPRLSFIGACNQIQLSSYTDPMDWSGGFTSRFVTFLAVRERLSLKRIKHVHGPVEDYLINWMREAIKTPPTAWGPYDGMTPEAHHMWKVFATAVDIVNPLGPGMETCGPQARTPMIAEKLAFLIGWSMSCSWPCNGGKPWKIDGRAMNAAIQIALMSYCSALSIAATTTTSIEMQQRARVLASVRADWTPTREILTASRVLNKRFVDIAETLLKEELIERQTGMGPDAGGFWRLRPGVLTADVSVGEKVGTEIQTTVQKILTGEIELPDGSPGALPLPDDPARPKALVLGAKEGDFEG